MPLVEAIAVAALEQLEKPVTSDSNFERHREWLSRLRAVRRTSLRPPIARIRASARPSGCGTVEESTASASHRPTGGRYGRLADAEMREPPPAIARRQPAPLDVPLTSKDAVEPMPTFRVRRRSSAPSSRAGPHGPASGTAGFARRANRCPPPHDRPSGAEDTRHPDSLPARPSRHRPTAGRSPGERPIQPRGAAGRPPGELAPTCSRARSRRRIRSWIPTGTASTRAAASLSATQWSRRSLHPPESAVRRGSDPRFGVAR